MSKKILIVSGEPSGDLHGANLVRDLKSIDNNLEFFGVGGELSAKSGVEIVFDITKLALVGVVEVVKHLSVVRDAHCAVMAKVKSENPDLAILVDYPGFNLRLARDLAGRGVPVVYYISPQIWAWGRQRIGIIKRCVKKVVVFFKFEEELYRSHGIDAEFVGHPLLDVVKVTSSKDDTLNRYGLSREKKTIAILPGSRETEIRTLLPILVKAAVIISDKLGNVQFLVSKHRGRETGLYEKYLKGSSLNYRFIEGDLHNIVAASDFAIVASGTATLETAILGTPMVIVYKASMLTYILYKMVITIPFLGIVNIIAGKEIAPEFLQLNMVPEKVAGKVVELMSDPVRLESMRKELAKVRSSLGSPGASLRAARAILPLLN